MKDSREEPKMIGEINFPNTIGLCSIYVYSNDTIIPHFHIITKDNIGECCISIFEPYYFNHGSKQLRLNSEQRKILNNWMNERSKSFPEITNWVLISRLWSIGNGDKYVPKNPIQPDYTDIIQEWTII